MVAPKDIVANEMRKLMVSSFDKIKGTCKQAEFILNIQEDGIYREIDLCIGFCHFLKVPSLVFPDIAEDCILGQCLTVSRAETSKKKKKIEGKIGVEMIFSILMLLSFHSNLLV